MPPLSFLDRLLVWYGCHAPDHRGKWYLHERVRRQFGIHVDGEHAVSRHGLQWLLNPSDFAHSSVFWFGMRDQWEVFHLLRLLTPGAVVVEAGAGFGYFAVTIAHTLGEGCRVIAFEPFLPNFERLQHHVTTNHLERLVECHQAAVSSQAGLACIAGSRENSGHAHLVADGAGYRVPVTTIDQAVTNSGVTRADALLIDVEGYEDRALTGASATLASFRPFVLVELWAPVMRSQGTTVEAAVQILRDHDYRLYRARRRELVPVVTLPSGDERLYAYCFHRDKIPAELKCHEK